MSVTVAIVCVCTHSVCMHVCVHMYICVHACVCTHVHMCVVCMIACVHISSLLTFKFPFFRS